MYAFSLPGGEKIALSELIEVLGVCEGTKFENVSELLAAIENVEFSDPTLIKVQKVNALTNLKLTNASADGEDELWAVKDENQRDLVSAFGADESGAKIAVLDNDWLLTSLKPFNTEETLTITLDSGEKFTVEVTDAQYGKGNIEIPDSGVVSMLDLATFTATVQSNTTDVDWDAHIDFLIRYSFSENGLDAIIDYAKTTGQTPTLVYDFSKIFDDTALNSAVAGSYYLTTGLRTVGMLTVSEDGKATLTFSDLDWLESRNSLRGTIDIELIVDENEAKDKTDDTVTFPGTSNGTKITYKDIVTNMELRTTTLLTASKHTIPLRYPH